MDDNGADERFEDMDDTGTFDEVDQLLDDELNVILDDGAREELEELVGLTVVGLDLWEESLGEAEDEEPVAPEERVFFDSDLLFSEGLALELYAAAVYPDPEGEPVKGMDQITKTVEKLTEENLQLLDFDQADEEGGLALAFGVDDQTRMVIAASAWLISEWEEESEEQEPE